MIDRKDLAVSVIVIVCLTISVFPSITSSQTEELPEYDPWVDPNDDGKIRIDDILTLALMFGAEGTPINKTALLLELLTKIENLNNTVIELENTINYLNTTIINLNETVVYLNGTQGLGSPDYDSGWVGLSKETIRTFNHNLGTTRLLVYMTGKAPYNQGHQMWYGGDHYNDNVYQYILGAYWYLQNENTICVRRYGQGIECPWYEVRVMIWKIQEPPT